MFASVTTWFITSKLGRGIALAGAVLLAIVTFGASQRSKGARNEKRKQAERRAKTVQEAREIDDDVNKISDSDVRSELNDWMRDE